MDIEIWEKEEVFTVKNDIQSLKRLVSKYAFSSKKYEFMTSPYLEKKVDDAFIEHVKDFFKLQFDQAQAKMIISVCRIFPSALHYVLSGENSNFIGNYQHREEIRKSGKDVGQLADRMLSSFFDQIVTNIRSNIQTLDNNYLSKRKGIEAFHNKSAFKISARGDLIFSASPEGIGYLAVAGGPIRSGFFVTTTDISVDLHIADTFRVLELYDDAIKKFDDVIQRAEGRRDILKAAWNNKGLCYNAQNGRQEAMRCYEMAMSIDPNCLEALRNLEMCYQELGENKKLEDIKKKIENLTDKI